METVMSDLLARVIVGNVVINPDILREFLRKSHYFMSYEPKTLTINFKVNDGEGGKDILYIHNASYESASKLADGLGLIADGKDSVFWSKWNPIYKLWHDGSEDAEKLRMEMLRLELPCRVAKLPYFDGRERSWAWSPGGSIYKPPSWSVDKVLVEIRESADRYSKQLTTTP